MFKDYYQILGINIQASQDEIKSAYREMSKKYHPDRNPNIDTITIMQDINEAYSILKDIEKRNRYDIEYRRFKQTYSAKKDNSEKNQNWNYEYEVENQDVKNDIEEARSFAEKLVKEFINSFKEATTDAADGFWEAVKGYIPILIIMFILGLCIRACM